MSTTLLQNELMNLITECKRKYPEIRTAAEKALQDLKSITVTSEQQLAGDLRRRPEFVDAFLKACATSNARLTVSGVVALQRLIISKGLPISRLDETLQAFNICAQHGLDIQLKVLQALPSLVQNYSSELHGELLGSALQVCAVLQGAKVSTISAVAAATLQQLVTSVLVKVAEEDSASEQVSAITTVHGEEGEVEVRPAAYDAFRVFRDLVLAAQGRSTQFVQLSTLSHDNCLELIASCIDAKPELLVTHEELSKIVRISVVSLATACLTENLSFTSSVRCIRLLRILILRYFEKYQAELEPAISLFAHTLEAETSPLWRRVLVMELLRDMFLKHSLILHTFMALDRATVPKPVVQDIFAAFVRLSSEKPALIGLGQQSTMPTGPSAARESNADSLVTDPVGGMTGMLSSLGVMETNVQGISTAWSIPKTACYDQLDKSQPPTLPETYIFSLVLECLNGLSDALAKVILPITMQHKHSDDDRHGDQQSEDELNPAVKAAADLIDSCWPAVLATCSTFMNAALDDGFYRMLIKAYQRFAQVAGLLRLNTPRDALMTTLGKAAVPPQVVNSFAVDHRLALVAESPRVSSNAKSLLSIESLVSQASSFASDKERRSSSDQAKVGLTVRNLLCLRALLNLAIALGPMLGDAFNTVVQVLRQADIVLSAVNPQQLARTSTNASQSDDPNIVQSFTTEIAAVEAAASRLLESTVDYSDEAFRIVLRAFGGILHEQQPTQAPIVTEDATSPPPASPRRSMSGLPGMHGHFGPQTKNYQFVLPKLESLAALNVHRFIAADADVSGWAYLTSEISSVAASNSSPASARRSAVDIACKLAAECIAELTDEDAEMCKLVQNRAFELMLRIITTIYDEDADLTSSDLEVHSHIINATRVILEQSGDSIAAGWDKILAIVSTTFDFESDMAVTYEKDCVQVDWSCLTNDFISLRLGREAFAAVQLLVTDFFKLLPASSTAAIIELLFRFMGQSDDLNLSLTAITTSWNVTDLLSASLEQQTVIPSIQSEEDARQFESQLRELCNSSQSAQWILLLVKLRQIVDTGEREISKAAFQTLCSIAKAATEGMALEMWSVVLRHILIGVLIDDAASSQWQARALTPTLLEGVAEVLSQQIVPLSRLPKLKEAWNDLDKILNILLSRKHIETTTAMYRAMAAILSNIHTSSQTWQSPVTQMATLWCKSEPSQLFAVDENNQHVFQAYVALAGELLRVQGINANNDLASSIPPNLAACVKCSGAVSYNADSQNMSQLQSQVLTMLQNLSEHDTDVITSLLETATDFARLHQQDDISTREPGRPSFVALGFEALCWLEQLVTQHIRPPSMLDARAFEQIVLCLADIIEEKYIFQTGHKGIWLWQKATAVAVAISEPILHMADRAETSLKQRIWHEYVRIACNVVHANGLASYHDGQRAFVDEHQDIQASRALTRVLIPRLGNAVLSDDELTVYMTALFEVSIVHALETTELLTPKTSVLKAVMAIRDGRVKHVPPQRREDMSYECFTQLIALATGNNELTREGQRLAKAAAPLLILRLAIPIRAYIVDQPLRGRMPQPLSELEELLYAFEQITDLHLDSAILGGDRAHVRYLYPLLAKAVRVAGDKRCGSREVLDPLQQLLEALTG